MKKLITTVQNNKSIVVVPVFNMIEVNKSFKHQKAGFKGSDDIDEYKAKDLNYVRLATLISQGTSAEKINMLYYDYMSLHDDTLGSKLQVVALNVVNKFRYVLAKNSINEQNAQVIAEVVGKMIPDSFKIEGFKDNTYDIPIVAVDNLIKIINSVDDYSDFFDSVGAYFKHMKRFGYDKKSDLPVVENVKIHEDYITLIYDRKLKQQNK